MISSSRSRVMSSNVASVEKALSSSSSLSSSAYRAAFRSFPASLLLTALSIKDPSFFSFEFSAADDNASYTDGGIFRSLICSSTCARSFLDSFPLLVFLRELSLRGEGGGFSKLVLVGEVETRRAGTSRPLGPVGEKEVDGELALASHSVSMRKGVLGD